MKYCALCCMVKDEDSFIKEWIAYHALLGFEHFIIYDDVSTVPVRALLDGWIAPHRISILRHQEHQSQYEVYRHCLETFGENFQWIGFLDMDEFIRIAPIQTGVCPLGQGSAPLPDIRAFLTEFEPYAGLGVNWRYFSWNGQEKTPSAPCIVQYTQCLGDDTHIKSLVQPSKVVRAATPHSFYTRPGEYIVDAEHTPIPQGAAFTVPKTRRIAINHYYYKSRECFAKKIQRGNPVHIARHMQQFDAHTELASHADTQVRAFFARVTAAVQAAQLPEAIFSRCGQETQPLEAVLSGLVADARALQRGDMSARDALLVRTAHCAMRCYARGQAQDASVAAMSQEAVTVALAQIWLVRAQISLAMGDMTAARFHVDQSSKLAQPLEGLQIMAEIYRRQGDLQSLQAVMEIIQACLGGLR